MASGDCGRVDLHVVSMDFLLAPQWNDEHFVLVGDAAHAFSHPSASVYGGQSLAASLKDATGLASNLTALTEDGVASDAAIASWAEQRHVPVSSEQAAALKVTRESQQGSAGDAGGMRSWLQNVTMSAVGSVGSLGYPALLRSSLTKL